MLRWQREERSSKRRQQSTRHDFDYLLRVSGSSGGRVRIQQPAARSAYAALLSFLPLGFSVAGWLLPTQTGLTSLGEADVGPQCSHQTPEPFGPSVRPGSVRDVDQTRPPFAAALESALRLIDGSHGSRILTMPAYLSGILISDHSRPRNPTIRSTFL